MPKNEKSSFAKINAGRQKATFYKGPGFPGICFLTNKECINNRRRSSQPIQFYFKNYAWSGEFSTKVLRFLP